MYAECNRSEIRKPDAYERPRGLIILEYLYLIYIYIDRIAYALNMLDT